jgi:putative transposase
MVTPDAKRNAVAHARECHGLSERRACDLIGIARRVARYQPSRVDDADPRQRLRELAAERRRFGYRRLGYLLAREGLAPNHKKLLRLYRDEGLKVRRRGGRKRALGTRAPMTLPQGPNQRWWLTLRCRAPGWRVSSTRSWRSAASLWRWSATTARS